MHLGFTGTREDLTAYQQNKVGWLLDNLKQSGFTHLHHGDCVGADYFAHCVALKIGYKIIVHPPTDDCYRTNVQVMEMRLECKPYLRRNRDIVNASVHLVACPRNIEIEKFRLTGEIPVRGGTWMTVRYALKKGIPISFVE